MQRQRPGHRILSFHHRGLLLLAAAVAVILFFLYGCVAGAVYLARTGADKEAIRDHVTRYYPLNFTLDEIREAYQIDVSCAGSVPQAMEAFLEAADFEDAIRGAVSTFDTFTHIPDLDTAIANAAFFMEEGGVFLFDMNTPYKHQKVLGENVFTFEEEDAACVWRNHYHPADRRVEITVDIDYRETGEHFHEQFYEYTYDLDTIRAALEKHGFVLEKVCDGESFGPLTEESERYFFCAVKQYTQWEEKENV